MQTVCSTVVRILMILLPARPSRLNAMSMPQDPKVGLRATQAASEGAGDFWASPVVLLDPIANWKQPRPLGQRNGRRSFRYAPAAGLVSCRLAVEQLSITGNLTGNLKSRGPGARLAFNRTSNCKALHPKFPMQENREFFEG